MTIALLGIINTSTLYASAVLSTASYSVGTVYQNTSNNLLYACKMVVSGTNATVNNIQFTLTGTHTSTELTNVYVYFNVNPDLIGANYLGTSVANFSAPKNYSININKTVNAGSSGYFIITFTVRDTAKDNKTVQINGATNPVTFGFTTATTVTNNQTNAAGVQTIQAADITLSSATIAADTLFQNSTSNIISATRMRVSTSSAIVNKVTFTLSGTHDANDLTGAYIYYNPTQVSLSGATYLGYVVPNLNAPATYAVNVYRQMYINDSGYFIISVNVRDTASDNKTVRIIAGTNPVVFGFSTKPNITNNQTSAAGLQTIQAADITLSSNAVAAGNIARGSTSNIVYILKAVVNTDNVVANNIQFTLSGTHDADDLSYAYVYENSTPSLIGASYLAYVVPNFAAPKQYSVNIYSSLPAGSTRYFIIVVNVAATASTGKTVQINGATNPVVLKYNTAPNVTNSQTNAAGVKTISISAPPGINNNSSNVESIRMVAAYPNPVLNELHIQTTENVTVLLTNRDGLLLSEKQINGNGIIDMSKYKPGIYFIKDKKTGYSLSVVKE